MRILRPSLPDERFGRAICSLRGRGRGRGQYLVLYGYPDLEAVTLLSI